ncbi:UNVERIFIED_CONTAM: hypothetical protein Sindi_2177900 [Sesamum indicum]
MLVSGATINQQKLIFQWLPIGPIPVSGPSNPSYRHSDTTIEQKMILGKLPKTVPVPPSVPSSRRNYPPPGLYHNKNTIQKKIMVGRLPIGVPIPASGPSGNSNIRPPLPSLFAK